MSDGETIGGGMVDRNNPAAVWMEIQSLRLQIERLTRLVEMMAIRPEQPQPPLFGDWSASCPNGCKPGDICANAHCPLRPMFT